MLDWHGESVAVDTACSSALTAVHQACEFLRSGRGRAVLAGSAHVLLNPSGYVGFTAASMLSPAGRCRTFSGKADGSVRAEGGGVVLLKRLGDALADGDRVHGTILASGATSDGRTAGMALPSDVAQEALLRAVHARAGISADDLAYLEMHGTGTSAGDQAECRAVGRALGALRTCGPLSVAGHSIGEVAAAHVAGALDLSAAARVVAARSRAQAATAGSGRMAAVGLSPEDARRELAALEGTLELAAVNSGQDVTVAGDVGQLEALGRQLADRGVFFRMLDLEYAFHSRAMDPI